MFKMDYTGAAGFEQPALHIRIIHTGSAGYLAVFYFIYKKFADNFSEIRFFLVNLILWQVL